VQNNKAFVDAIFERFIEKAHAGLTRDRSALTRILNAVSQSASIIQRRNLGSCFDRKRISHPAAVTERPYIEKTVKPRSDRSGEGMPGREME
jgi:hypothetical protein